MKNKQLITEGQISIFDIEITEKPKKITKEEEKMTETEVLATENKETSIVETFELTNKQQKVIDNFKVSQPVNRVIIYSKGAIGIEVREEDKFITHYINRDGKEEFSFTNKSPVLPWDKIIYYENQKVPLTKVQIDKLQALLSRQRDSIKRVIHRKADENILVEFEDMVVSIIPIGWELPFESINTVECSEDEVYLVPKAEQEDPAETQKKAKVGDYVQAMRGKELIEGELYSEYNSGHTFNIIFENGTKHTAIPRIAITKILKSA